MATKSLASQRALKGAATRRARNERDKELAGDFPQYLYDKEKDELTRLSLKERAILNTHRKLPEDLKPRFRAAMGMKGEALTAELTSVLNEFRNRGGEL